MSRSLSRRPAGLKGRDLDIHVARCFIGDRCVLGSSLVVPGMVLWREFKSWAEAHGHKACPTAFRQLLDQVPWAEVNEMPHARGTLKSIVKGVGLKPTAP